MPAAWHGAPRGAAGRAYYNTKSGKTKSQEGRPPPACRSTAQVGLPPP